MIVFGCIILSFTLSSLKRKSSSWAATVNAVGGGPGGLGGAASSAWLGLVSGSVNLGHLASTTVGHSGIIQPSIQYREKKSTEAIKRPATATENSNDR